MSEVALCAANWDPEACILTIPIEGQEDIVVHIEGGLNTFDLSEKLGIKEHIPQG